MDKCVNFVHNNHAWQASIPSFFRHIKQELDFVSNSPLVVCEKAPKKLTNEAIYMIFVLISFVSLAVIGTAITAFEFFSKTIPTKNYDDGNSKNTREGNSTRVEEKASRHSDFKAWFGYCKSFFQCFCTLRNGRKIFSTVHPDGHMPWIDGLRVCASIYAIFVHFWLFVFAAYGTEELISLGKLWCFQFLMNSTFDIDLFLILGGFLNGYAFSKTWYKSKGNINWFNYYAKRLLRITPSYMVVLGFYATLFQYMGSKPLWPTYETNPVCKESWWWNLLYINNFKPSEDQCMLWAWYLATDMQVYIVSPLFLISLLRWPKFGYILTGMGIFGSSFASFMITKNYGLVDGFSRLGYHAADPISYMYRVWEYIDRVYNKPYTRINSYLIGLALGYYLCENRVSKDHTKSKVSLVSGWIMFAIGMWICYFSFYGREENVLETAIYNGGKNVVSSCCFAWIIYVCFTGQGGFLDRFFSLKIFSHLSTLSYSAYLVHMLFLIATIYSKEKQPDISISVTVCVLCVFAILRLFLFSYMAAIVLSVFVELPVMNLHSFFTKTREQRIKKIL